MAMLFVAVVEVATVLAIVAVGAGYLYRRTARRLKHREEIERRVHGQRSRYHEFVVQRLGNLRARLGRQQEGLPSPVRHIRKVPAELAPERVTQSLQLEYLEFEHLSVQTAEAAVVDFWARRESGTRKLLDSLARAEEILPGLLKAIAGEHGDTRSTDVKRLQHRLSLRDRQIRQLTAQLRDVRPYRARFRRLHGQAAEGAAASRDLTRVLRGRFGEQVEPLLAGYERKRARLDEFLADPEVAPLEARASAVEQSEGQQRRSHRMETLLTGAESRIDRHQAVLRRQLQDQDGVIERLKNRLDMAASNNQALKHRYEADIGALRRSVKESEATAREMEKENHRLRRLLRELKHRNSQQSQAVDEIADMERTIDQFARQAGAMRDRIKAMEANVAGRAWGEH
ncbi:MAG TPA: hypothetical protein VKA32_02745 [Gammaproteobacteria bacterium]|nr:hypothetical protein [Gammaproteobacteria bacterium]